MRAVLGIGKGLLKALFIGVVFIGTCVMNFIGAIICAITEWEGAMAKKEETPLRRARRNYEVRNKTEREQATKQYNTRLPRELHDKICAFLKKNRITKVELIVAGYQALLDHYGPKEQQNKE